jgi:hypothetical protein
MMADNKFLVVNKNKKDPHNILDDSDCILHMLCQPRNKHNLLMVDQAVEVESDTYWELLVVFQDPVPAWVSFLRLFKFFGKINVSSFPLNYAKP